TASLPRPAPRLEGPNRAAAPRRLAVRSAASDGWRSPARARGSGMGASRLPSALSAAGNWVRFLGHATVEVELQGTRLLTDPVLRNRLGPLVRQPWIDGPVPHPDAVLI